MKPILVAIFAAVVFCGSFVLTVDSIRSTFQAYGKGLHCGYTAFHAVISGTMLFVCYHLSFAVLELCQ